MSLDALRDFIDSEPANASKTDVEVMDWLNESVTSYQDVDWQDFAIWMSLYGLFDTFETEAANTDNTPAGRSACRFCLAVVAAGKDLPTADDNVRNALGNLRTDNIISVAERDAIVAHAQISVPRWQEEGITRPKLHHVEICGRATA